MAESTEGERRTSSQAVLEDDGCDSQKTNFVLQTIALMKQSAVSDGDHESDTEVDEMLVASSTVFADHLPTFRDTTISYVNAGLLALPDELLCLILGTLKPVYLDIIQKCCRRMDALVQETYRRRYGGVIPHRRPTRFCTWQMLFHERQKILADFREYRLSTNRDSNMLDMVLTEANLCMENVLQNSRLAIAMLANHSTHNSQNRLALATALMAQKRFHEAEPHYDILFRENSINVDQLLLTLARYSWPFTFALAGDPSSATKTKAMLEAIRAGNLRLVKTFQAQGVPVDIDYASTCAAASSGNLSMMEYIIEQGVHFLPKEESLYNPLFEAVAEGHLNMIRFLVERGVKWLPCQFHIAIEMGHVHVLKDCVDISDLKSAISGSTLSKRAMLDLPGDKRRAMIQYLVEAGDLNVNPRHSRGRTLLSHAIQRGESATIKLLQHLGRTARERRPRRE